MFILIRVDFLKKSVEILPVEETLKDVKSAMVEDMYNMIKKTSDFEWYLGRCQDEDEAEGETISDADSVVDNYYNDRLFGNGRSNFLDDGAWINNSLHCKEGEEPEGSEKIDCKWQFFYV